MALSILSIASLSEAAPTLSNLTVAQRPGTRLVDLTYSLLAPGLNSVTVKLEISSDGGATWTVPAVSATGAIGQSVAPGNDKVIVWNAATDWPGQISEQMKFRLTVDEGFALIPGGTFTMGRTGEDTDAAAPSVSVYVSSFYMAKFEVTKQLWDEVRTWGLANGYSDLPTGSAKAANHPIHSISWYAVVKWCNARSQKEGLTPCYSVSSVTYKTGNSDAVACNWSASGYRLPTEAEWEKAARGGGNGQRFPWGDTITHSQANYASDTSKSYDVSPTRSYHPTYVTGSIPYTAPVGSFAANGYGLHDMVGNVWDYCWDWYSDSYYITGVSDPRGPASGLYRVGRGGGWGYDASYCRTSDRVYGTPGITYDDNTGFRPARIQPLTIATSEIAETNTTTIPVFTQAPSGQTSANPNANVTLTAAYVSGLQPFTYRWRKNGTIISGATGSTYTIASAKQSDEASYDCVITNSFGSFTTSATVLTVNDPVVIVTPPLAQAANAGQQVTLRVNVTGTEPISFQWRKNGVPLSDQNAPQLVLEVDANSTGFYDVVVTNPLGSIYTLPALLTALVPPVLTSQPSSQDYQNLSVGSTAFFSVTADGPNLTYQWRRNGSNLSGQTSSMLMLSNIQNANEGVYDVLVKNSFGAVLSDPVWLSLLKPLSITEPPQDVTASPGDTASFAVAATGQGTLTYQWNKDGKPIKGAKSSTLNVPVADPTAAGAYTVTVASGSLKVTSAPAYLRVPEAGLLIYKFTLTGNSYEGTSSSKIALSGLLVLDRLNQRGGIIRFGKNGKLATFVTQVDDGLRTDSTGPVTNSQTVVSKVVKAEESPEQETTTLWLRGTDGPVTFSSADKTMAPKTLSGFQTELGLADYTQVTSLSLAATLDNAASLLARQAGETVEQTLNRLAAGLQLKGFIRE
jgi:formylglycine-generating enzyme required for sulfatase activity